MNSANRFACALLMDASLISSAALIFPILPSLTRRDKKPRCRGSGFAQGRPGAFLRATRAMVRVGGKGRAETMYELLEESLDQESFRKAIRDVRLSDVLDLTWMAAGPLELRSVQGLLEHLTSAVLPGAEARFSPYDQPRYRSALQLQISGVAARAAHGGVLMEWPGRPNGADAAHVRIFLEPWAMIRWGRVIEFEPLPHRGSK